MSTTNEKCRCQIVGSTRDPAEPHIATQPEWEQAADCPVHPLLSPEVPHENKHTIIDTEQVKSLPAGQWARDANGDAICLMDTHMGFPQRMWGSKSGGGTKGYMSGYVSLDRAAYPLHLGDADTDACPHKQTNECGQCIACGLPSVGVAEPLFFDAKDEATFRAAAAHNANLATNPQADHEPAPEAGASGRGA